MAKQQIKKVSFELKRGIFVNGKSIYPAKKGKKTIITIPLQFAKELQAASKGLITDQKANTETVESKDDDGLDDVFGGDVESGDE